MMQPTLFSLPRPEKLFDSAGAARAYYGQVVQTAVCGLLGLSEIPGGGPYDVIMDAECRNTGQLFEIKSVHATNKIPLYVWRLVKDEECGANPIYLFAIHTVRGASSVQECWGMMGLHLSRIVALRHSTVSNLVECEPLRQLVKEDPSSRLGYKRKGYCDGYRNLTVKKVLDAADTLVMRVEGKVNETLFSCDVFAESSITHFLDKSLVRT